MISTAENAIFVYYQSQILLFFWLFENSTYCRFRVAHYDGLRQISLLMDYRASFRSLPYGKIETYYYSSEVMLEPLKVTHDESTGYC